MPEMLTSKTYIRFAGVCATQQHGHSQKTLLYNAPRPLYRKYAAEKASNLLRKTSPELADTATVASGVQARELTLFLSPLSLLSVGKPYQVTVFVHRQPEG